MRLGSISKIHAALYIFVFLFEHLKFFRGFSRDLPRILGKYGVKLHGNIVALFQHTARFIYKRKVRIFFAQIGHTCICCAPVIFQLVIVCFIFNFYCFKYIRDVQRIIAINRHSIPADREVAHLHDQHFTRCVFIGQDVPFLQPLDLRAGMFDHIDQICALFPGKDILPGWIFCIGDQCNILLDHHKVRIILSIQIHDTILWEVAYFCRAQFHHDLCMGRIRIHFTQRCMFFLIQQECLNGIGFRDFPCNRHLGRAIAATAGYFYRTAGHHFLGGVIRINSHHKVCRLVCHKLHTCRMAVELHLRDPAGIRTGRTGLFLQTIHQQLAKAVGRTYGHIGGIHLSLSGLLLLCLGMGCLQKRVGCNGSHRFLIQPGRGIFICFFHCNNGCRIAVRSRKSSHRRNVQRHCQCQKHRKDSFHRS